MDSKLNGQEIKEIFCLLDFLTFQYGSNGLSRNVNNEIPLCGPQYQTVTHILLTSHRKPEITHFNSLSIAVSFIVRQFNGCSILTCVVVLKRGAYVVVRVQLRTWVETFCYGLNVVAFVWSENWEAQRLGMCSEFGENKQIGSCERSRGNTSTLFKHAVPCKHFITSVVDNL